MGDELENSWKSIRKIKNKMLNSASRVQLLSKFIQKIQTNFVKKIIIFFCV